MPSFFLNETLHGVIEPARLSDIDEIVSLEHRAFLYPWPRNLLLAELDGESFSHVYVARLIRDDGVPQKIIGYNFFWLVADEIHILHIAVDPEHQHRGLGKLLLDFAADFGRRHGACCMILEVRVSNAKAQGLYRKLGFQQIGIRKNYYSPNNEDAYAMKKML
ncbi:ribosomal-protein-alanine N-acetyltransferase [candidate division KSB3 bacterium]|uniref:Ribosomal-protein-alanine N-acetyltransferase n=1 Tax=candidate division KSB3 bacterium TaxID=2044937 RepID=A0A2G6E271_9BACT|nr:MAG: ribosomal-protein-alanine N-acetyltransferase [candidate division KSB3 bacterium]PIE28708.1 MAG: ribosomal-protein-alanine N-acetyltransferase [candidate division KSB3 bacterium]